MSVLSGKDDTPTKFSIGEHVFVQDNKMYDILAVSYTHLTLPTNLRV